MVDSVPSRGIRNPGVRQCLGFCTAVFLSSLAYESADKKPKHCLTPGFLIVTDTSGTTKRFPVHKISNLTLQFTFKISIAANDRVCHGPSGPAEAAAGTRPAGQVHQPVEHREELHRDELYKNRSSGKSILGDYFQGNRTSRRDLFSY